MFMIINQNYHLRHVDGCLLLLRFTVDNNIKLLDDEETGNTIYGSEPLGELHKYALLVRAVGESNNVLFLTRRKPS